MLHKVMVFKGKTLLVNQNTEQALAFSENSNAATYLTSYEFNAPSGWAVCNGGRNGI